MGREIRMVPPNYEHPLRDPEHDTYRHGGYQPTYDRTFDEVFAEWLANFDRVRAGNLDDIERECYPNGLSDWLTDEGTPPIRAYYRTYDKADATWFQLWETVSEGTPVSPPFATKEELAAHLAEHGDDWDQKRGDGGWGMKSATAFVNMGWAPSAMLVGGEVIDSKDIPASFEAAKS